MSSETFTYGPLAAGTYRALLFCTAPLAFANPHFVIYTYVPVLLFLGLGLKPLLILTGLHEQFSALQGKLERRIWKSHTGHKAEEVDKREKAKMQRHSHRRDSQLPKNW